MKLIDADSKNPNTVDRSSINSSLAYSVGAGQVFEKHIGIDRAFWSTQHAVFALHDFLGIPPCCLIRYNWDYIWTGGVAKDSAIFSPKPICSS